MMISLVSDPTSLLRESVPNHYDVAKATDENLTSENWELILNICDKVADEGETGYVYRLLRCYYCR